ncbi:MAG TPA: orange carotenoid protein N-terminal domain-containing protein [Crinalium sp.]|jgi:hypothetical protein
MTSTGTNSTQHIVKKFKQLDVKDQLLVLASTYLDVKGSLSSQPAAGSNANDVGELLNQVKEMRQENQLEFLQDVLSDRQSDADRVELDPHPSKAMVELMPGVKPPLSRYRDLDQNSRLAFWYAFGREMESQIAPNVQSFTYSEQGKDVINSLKSLSVDEKVAFLNHLV